MSCKVTVLTVRSLLLNIFLMFISSIYGVGGFKAAELRITPRVVQKGKNVTMECFHERQNFKPYSVKWYRDTTMFYKFTPMEMPSYRFYEVPGMLIDRLNSNDTHVVLMQVPMSLTGNYSCEVVLQTPGYPVYVAQSRLEVVGAGGLRVKELRIIPPIVQRGSEVTLICLYQLFDAPLYSVKWYRGRHEFFRHTPTESPNTKVFPFAGINVDVARSNGSQAVLTRVTFGLSGNFSCEVTADAPSFATSIVSSHMEVVVLPTQPPIVQTERMHYSSGEVLAANCSSEPSRPQSILAFFINEMPIMPGQLRVQQASEGLFRSELSIAVKLLDHHYKKGAPVLRCESVIGDIYKEYTEIALYAANGDPKIERVTSPGAACQRLKSALLLNVSMIVCIFRTIN